MAIGKRIFFFLRGGGRLALMFLFFSFLFSCGHIEGVSVTAVQDGNIGISRLAVLPFVEIIPGDSASGMAGCPLCGTVFQADKITGASVSFVEDIFMEQLQGRTKSAVIPPEVAGEVHRRVAAALNAPLPEVLRKTGLELGVDGIVVGYVYRFRERKGFAYAVEKPASVAFDIHLLRVSDGRIVWRGSFDKTQSSLMENILQIASFYKWRGRWVTAGEMANEGVTAMLKKFPGI